ncbi:MULTISPECIES: hypothetical protein [unclassified Leptolyngbya]|uniref:hypothetical protein n=1 Tax=unclassified Leptolyngbya TaxID=2650499 RepID=UPI001689F7B0|nr:MULTISPECIES: hypothetical protein [unclassified Leptolyngbya]MBD1909485.1 hypothetical protein [Leptolyngbya sp. FACHB-8]MBD2153362.1 hypothetical protein [Leptolyngbya sp. FACHB-16]
MSENYPAENRSDSSQPNQNAASWYSGWEEFSEAAETDSASVSEGEFPAIAEQDWHPVDPPQAMRVSDLEQATAAKAPPPGAQPSPPIDLPNWSVRTIPPQAPAVAMPAPQAQVVEEPSEHAPDVNELISLIQELNQCNSALLDRVAHLEDALEHSQRTDFGQVAPTSASPLISAEQVTQLFQELESAHQASQRQQVLIETLSEQLNSNQDHITHLESNYAQLQQRLQEQAQQLAQREQVNRDLQVRLQRQQRYTLQFKAALERCLEVSTPPFDLPDMSAANASVVEPIPGVIPAPPLSPKVRQIQPWSSGDNASLPSKLDVLRGQPLPLPNQPNAAQSAAIAPAPEPYTPLIDGSPIPPLQLPIESTGHADPELQASSGALQAAAEELKSVLTNLLRQDPVADPTAEEDVWQDLARLVEVSPEDVVRASQAEDVGQFVPPPRVKDPTPKPQLSMPSEVFQQKNAATRSQPIPPVSPQNPNGTSPAPIVYPFRPLKKIDSLASVDLPSFPRPGTVG